VTHRPDAGDPSVFQLDGRKIKSVKHFYREIGRSVNASIPNSTVAAELAARYIPHCHRAGVELQAVHQRQVDVLR
jgi:hypothetical protein